MSIFSSVFIILIILIQCEDFNKITNIYIDYESSSNNYNLIVAEGEEFAIKFLSIPSAGFDWFLLNTEILDESFIKYINTTYEKNDKKEKLDGAPINTTYEKNDEEEKSDEAPLITAYKEEELIGGVISYYLFFKALKQTDQEIYLDYVYKRDWEEEIISNASITIKICKLKKNGICQNDLTSLSDLDLNSPKYYYFESKEMNQPEKFYLTVKEDKSYDYYYIYTDNKNCDLDIKKIDNQGNEIISNENPCFKTSDKVVLSQQCSSDNSIISFYVIKLTDLKQSESIKEGEILSFKIDTKENQITKNIKTSISEKNFPAEIFIKSGINKDLENKITVFGENLNYDGFYYKLNSNIDKITILSSMGKSEIIPIIVKLCVFSSNMIQISENTPIELNHDKFGIYKFTDEEVKIKVESNSGTNIYYYYIYLTKDINIKEQCFNSPKFSNNQIFIEKDSFLNLIIDLDLERKNNQNEVEYLYLIFSVQEDSKIIITEEITDDTDLKIIKVDDKINNGIFIHYISIINIFEFIFIISLLLN